MQTRSLILSALFASAPALAAEPCLLTPGQPPAATGQQRVSPDNWLNPGYLRFGLSQVPRFMPGVRVQPATPAPAPTAAPAPNSPSIPRRDRPRRGASLVDPDPDPVAGGVEVAASSAGEGASEAGGARGSSREAPPAASAESGRTGSSGIGITPKWSWSAWTRAPRAH